MFRKSFFCEDSDDEISVEGYETSVVLSTGKGIKRRINGASVMQRLYGLVTGLGLYCPVCIGFGPEYIVHSTVG